MFEGVPNRLPVVVFEEGLPNKLPVVAVVPNVPGAAEVVFPNKVPVDDVFPNKLVVAGLLAVVLPNRDVVFEPLFAVLPNKLWPLLGLLVFPNKFPPVEPVVDAPRAEFVLAPNKLPEPKVVPVLPNKEFPVFPVAAAVPDVKEVPKVVEGTVLLLPVPNIFSAPAILPRMVQEERQESTSWIQSFLSFTGHEVFCEIDVEYLSDPFSMMNLDSEVPCYKQALLLILDRQSKFPF